MPIKQTAASRTRSRTSQAAKAAAGIAVPPESLSPAPVSAAEEEDELVKEMDEISCVVTVTDTPNAMDISPDNSALQLKPPAASHLADDFAMDVDKSEEIAVQEQLQLISPTVSELEAQSSGGRPAIEYMDIETELADPDVVPSRYFSKGVGTTVISLDSQGQQIATTSITEAKPNGEVDSDQEEDDVEGADDGPNPLQKFVNRILNTSLIELRTERMFLPWTLWVQNTHMWLSDLTHISRWKPGANRVSPILVIH